MAGAGLVKGMKHPFGRALYEQDGNGNVLVTQEDGAWGRFRQDGRWLEGNLKEADPHFCGWVGGPVMVNHRIKVDV